MAVQQKIVSGNDSHVGAVANSPRAESDHITNYSVNYKFNKDMSVGAADARLDAFYDDPRYYTGDAVT